MSIEVGTQDTMSTQSTTTNTIITRVNGVETIKEVPQIEYVDKEIIVEKVIDKPVYVEKIIEKPVERVVEKRVEEPITEFIEVPREVEVEKIVYVDVIEDEPVYVEKYQEYEFNVHRLAIMDQLVSSDDEMKDLVKYIDEAVKKNEKVLLHCVGGLGRSGLAAASYLKYKGLNSDEAIKAVRKVRGPRTVESKIQEEFVENIQFNAID